MKHQNKAAVNDVGLQLWLVEVIKNRTIRERMLSIMLDMVERERHGEVITRGVMRSITAVSAMHLRRPVAHAEGGDGMQWMTADQEAESVRDGRVHNLPKLSVLITRVVAARGLPVKDVMAWY